MMNIDMTTQFHFCNIPIADSFATEGNSKPSLSLIAGDASDRKFFRLKNATESAICMEFPKWEGGYGGDPLSWLGMHAALQAIGIPVPKVLHIDQEKKCIWTEDFGDNFLNFGMQMPILDSQNQQCENILGHYKQAIALLVKVQYPHSKIPDHPALNRAFDTEKLMFEVNFFKSHFINGLLNSKIYVEQTYGNFNSEFENLCQWLSDQPRVLCHRDYHVRNVMVVDDEARWIDFQDARMGPHSYDLVSLIRDSYVRITDKTRDELTQYYLKLTNARRSEAMLTPISNNNFEIECHHMGLQRNIKALGSFGYLATVKNKPQYLCYVSHTLETLCNAAKSTPAGEKFGLKYPTIFAFLNDCQIGHLAAAIQGQLTARKIRSF